MRKIKELYQNMIQNMKKKILRSTIQRMIAVSFTLVAIGSMIVLGITLYRWFAERMENMAVENSEQLLKQTSINLDTYLRSMREISDTMYYNVIKDKDLADESIDAEMNLIYESNKDNLVSIACFTNTGKLVAASPFFAKESVEVKKQDWFTRALDQMENLHFSTPHAEWTFNDMSYRYHWVVSLSHAVELTNDGEPSLGVLLVDMNYSSIEQLFDKVNTTDSTRYIYLMDRNGEIIYHPKQQLIYSGLFQENNMALTKYEDGSHQETFQGERRLTTIKTVSYTGWKIVCVSPLNNFQFDISETRYFMIILIAFTMLMLISINQIVSRRIAKPLQKLNESVKEWESGNMEADIYVGGSYEVEHLGKTLRATREQINHLMQEILVEQEEKRKSELDALQSQINPHFLYNTLDSIVWMIEGERYDEAVFMITQLASLFRISLSRGKTIISIEDEITHVKNYMNIQRIRYKNKFTVDYEIDEEILPYCTVKLVLQPLLENAIYYGVESMGEDGEILVKGYRSGDSIYIEITDNGLGMPDEMVEQLLTEDNRIRTKGSGVGVINVHKRIRLRFGEPYGLEIRSVLDEGTTVRVHLPVIPYEEDSVRRLERSGDE